MTTLAWGTKVSPEFRRRVLRMGTSLRLDPSWIMAIIAFETGRTFSPAKRNALSGATGLIQFIPSTAADLNTTTDALAAMTDVEQLDYVDRYFSRYAGRMDTLASAYMAVLWPRAVSEPDDAVIFEAPSKAYAQNRALDTNNDGKITKAEAAAFVARALAEGMQYATEERDPRPDAVGPFTQGNRMGALAAAGLVGQLLQTVISVFQPAARAKVEQAAEKVTDPAGAKVLADSLMAVLQQVTGIADPIQATAAVTAATPQAQALLARVETQTVQKLDEVGAYLEQISKMAIGLRAASDDSADRAARRADTPNGWKLRLQQASFTQRTLGCAIIVIATLVALMQVSLFWLPDIAVPATQNLLGQLVILEVALITGLVATFRDQNGFSFGGVVDGNIAREGLEELHTRRAAALGSKSA